MMKDQNMKHLISLTFVPALLGAMTLNSAQADSFMQQGDERSLTVGFQRPYVGLNIGLADVGAGVEKTGSSDVELQSDQITLGGFAGFDLLSANFGGHGILVGVEGDLSPMSLDESKTDPTLGLLRAKSGYVATLRLRAGYAWEKTYLYATTGAAFSDVKVNDHELGTGAALGVGGEYLIDDKWSARAEGMITAFGDEETPINGTNRKAGGGKAALRLGVAYSF